MDANIISNQIQMLKNSLVFDLNNQMKKNPERIGFSQTYYYVQNNNPDEVYSIYGIENGAVLVDSFFVGKTAFDVGSLPLEIILSIKKELENYLNLQAIKSRM